MSRLSTILNVERVEKYAGFVRLKEEWNELLSCSGQNSPFLTHQWFDAWWQSFGKNKELEILIIRDEQNFIIGLAPLMVSEGSLSFMANHEVTDYCDFVSREEYRAKFYEVLLDWLQKNSSYFSGMEFMNIPAASPSLSRFPRLASSPDFAWEIKESEVVPLVSLPDSYEKYIQGLDRKNRHELRRKIRKLESTGPVRIERIIEPSTTAEAILEFISLHRKSSLSKQDFWQKDGISEFFQELTALFSSESWIELYFLSVGDRLIGGLVNFLYKDTLFLYNVAYDKAYSSLSPGFYLFDQAIEKAIEEGRKTVDFLRGDEKYKYFFGAKDSRIYSLMLSRKEIKK
jgi:CelD/BcsL family acetyltransferase involved in cellulose biosynthesis